MKINLNATVKTKDHDGYKAVDCEEKMWHVTKEQHEFVECMTPDGPSDDFSWKIVLTNFFTGEVYVLKREIVGKINWCEYECEGYVETQTWYENGRRVADDLIEKITKKGEVDLTFWEKVN